MSAKKIFIPNFRGLCNRLETLFFAYAVRDCYGHEIFVEDWPELKESSLRIHSIHEGKFLWHHRLGCLKLKKCEGDTFLTLNRYRNLHIRGMILSGVRESLLDRQAHNVVRDLRPHPSIIAQIEKLFEPTVPVVGVHLRRGDYEGADFDSYDVNGVRFPAVPDWWYLWVMGKIREKHPNVRFYLSFTGQPSSYEFLTREFDCFYFQSSPAPKEWEKNTASWAVQCQSFVNPISDLFALACCPTIVATPLSSFSHWAANCLGEASTILMPPDVMQRSEPKVVSRKMGFCRFPTYERISRTNAPEFLVGGENFIPDPAPVSTSWL